MTPSFQFPHVVEAGFGVVDQVVQEAAGQLAGGEPDVLLSVLEDDVVDAALARTAGLAARHLRPGQVLQLEGDVLEHVPHPGSLAHPLEEAAAMPEGAPVVVKGGDQIGQALEEPWDVVRRAALELADVEEEMNDRHARPDTRAAVDPRLTDLQHRTNPYPCA